MEEVKEVKGGPFPLPAKGDIWGLNTPFVPGVYDVQLESVAAVVTDDKRRAVDCRMRVLSAPNEAPNDLVGGVYTHRFWLITNGNAAYFRGFLYQVDPLGLEPQNCTQHNQPRVEFYLGAKIRIRMVEDTFKDAKTGEERTVVRMQSSIVASDRRQPEVF